MVKVRVPAPFPCSHSCVLTKLVSVSVTALAASDRTDTTTSYEPFEPYCAPAGGFQVTSAVTDRRSSLRPRLW
jgi:hypothetical protein